MSLFPFTVRSCRASGWVPQQLRDAWFRLKPKDLTWYGLDTKILSPTEVEFTTYEMRCNYYGGIGDVKYREKFTVDPSVTRDFIEGRAEELAVERLVAEEEAARSAKIAEYQRQILERLDATA